MLITKPSDGFKKCFVGRNDTSFTLHRLYDHRADIVTEGLGKCRSIVKGQMLNRARQGAETLAVIGLPSGGYRKERPPMKSIVECQDSVLLLTVMVECITAGQFKGGFIGLCPGITEKDLIRECEFHQPPGQLQRRLCGQNV